MAIAPPLMVLDLHPHTENERQMTTCRLAIRIDGVAAWPVHGEQEASIEIQIDDLLAYLTEFWKPLILRQVYPIDVSPSRPSDLRRKAEDRWAEIPPEIVEDEDDAVSRFEEAHDLARAFAGIYGLPPFWIFRSCDQFALETSGVVWRAPFADVRAALATAGDWICERLRQADEQRWEAAIKAWQERSAGDAPSLLAWSTGLDRTLATTLINDGTLDAPRDFEDAANDNDELRIAARMAGALPPDQIRKIIAIARQFDRHVSGPLGELSRTTLQHITERFDRARPFEQGEAAARFVREQLNLTDRRVEVFEIAAFLGIDVRHAPTEPTTLAGLAIWGNRFGPGVFLNEASRRILGQGKHEVTESFGARVTLAHELCHLLIDGAHALSAVEVLKARMPPGVEQRAKSFAGEFLLPTQSAAQHWQKAARPTNREGLEALVKELTGMYAVTHSVAAWKIEHAARDNNINLSFTLDAIAPYR